MGASSDVLTAAVHAAVAWQMARVLIASKVADLSEADINRTLFKAGFGRHSIKALHRRAARMARSFKTEKGRGAEE